jgi:hypothetical protein
VPELDVVDGGLVSVTCPRHDEPENKETRPVGGVYVDVALPGKEPVTLRGHCQQCGQRGHDHKTCPNHGTVDGLYIGGRPCAV